VSVKKGKPIVIAIDGTSASGKSTTAKLVAQVLGYVYVDTGSMYRTLAWYCLKKQIDVNNKREVVKLCRQWKTSLECVESDGIKQARLLVEGYYPCKEIRIAETSAAVPIVAAIPGVRDWMKKIQRSCIKFGNLVMEGRDIGSNIFPETEFKFWLDASLEERARRRSAEGVKENLAERDTRDSQRSAAPLMVPLGAMVIDNSKLTPTQTADLIINEIKRKSETVRKN